MATMTATTTQASSTTSTSTISTRERISLAPWMEAVKDDKGERTLGFALRLSGMRFLPGDGTHKPSYSGMMEAAFIDPVTGEVPTFVNAKGETVRGKCPVRLLGIDGLSAHKALGLQQDKHLLLGLKPETETSVYRTEGGAVAFLVLRLGDLTSAARWVDPPVTELAIRDFNDPAPTEE